MFASIWFSSLKPPTVITEGALAGGSERVSASDVVETVESDIALVVAVLRLANEAGGGRTRVESIVEAVRVLSPEAVQELAGRVRTFDFFERTAVWQGVPKRFRLHGVATQRIANQLARELGYESRDYLMMGKRSEKG